MAKRERFISPAGVARYPHLHRPDDRPINGVPQTPRYKLDLALEAGAAEEIKALINDRVEQSYKEACDANRKVKKQIQRQYPYFAETDDDGDVTGRLVFRFKQNAQIKRKDGTVKDVVVQMFDAKGQQLKDVKPFGGTVLKAAYSIRPYFMAATKSAGVTLDLQAVQILELVNAGERSAESFGFGVEEGYVAEASGAGESSDEDADEDDDGDEDEADF